jgi:hypothetical protein
MGDGSLLEVKGPGLGLDHSPTFSAEVKEKLYSYTSVCRHEKLKGENYFYFTTLLLT